MWAETLSEPCPRRGDALSPEERKGKYAFFRDFLFYYVCMSEQVCLTLGGKKREIFDRRQRGLWTAYHEKQ